MVPIDELGDLVLAGVIAHPDTNGEVPLTQLFRKVFQLFTLHPEALHRPHDPAENAMVSALDIEELDAGLTAEHRDVLLREPGLS